MQCSVNLWPSPVLALAIWEGQNIGLYEPAGILEYLLSCRNLFQVCEKIKQAILALAICLPTNKTSYQELNLQKTITEKMTTCTFSQSALPMSSANY